MPLNVKLYLRQLKTDELSLLARQMGAKLPGNTTAKSLIEILYAYHVSKQHIIALLSKAKGRTGIYAKYDGEAYEKKVFHYFQKQGYKCKLNQRSKGVEFDIVCEKGRDYAGLYNNKKWLVVECKNKPIVTNQDLQKFAGKLKGFQHEHEEEDVNGYLITSGIFEPLALSELKKHKDIKYKRMRF